VVKAAQKTLATRDVGLVLIWVQVDDEAEIRAAFEQSWPCVGWVRRRENVERLYEAITTSAHGPFAETKPTNNR